MTADLASTFTWLAYSEREHREAQDLASTLSESETRDELGIGSIRDALADRLFPGTSTIQSRARYFLFVPWIFQILENESRGSSRQRADELERRLASALRRSSDTEGLVGLRTLAVGRLPSSIYWSGLGVLGVRRFDLTLSEYYRWLDEPRRTMRVLVDDDGLPLSGETKTIWDELPEPPKGLLETPAFALTSEESAYLRLRAESATPQQANVLAILFEHARPDVRTGFPWEYPWQQLDTLLPAHVQEELEVAELFSLGHHGAALLFNLLIARALGDDERLESYAEQVVDWQVGASARLGQFDLDRLWALTTDKRISPSTRKFVEKWFALVREVDGRRLYEDEAATSLVWHREVSVKTARRSRLANPRRVPWNGASGSGRLDYRWGSVQRMVIDVAEGRARA